jgi:hypothetical protein
MISPGYALLNRRELKPSFGGQILINLDPPPVCMKPGVDF